MDNLDTCGINKFFERDIDLLFAEELRVNSAFCLWVLKRFDIPVDLIVPAYNVNISVVEDGSEADVVASFRTTSGSLHRLFIENKIDAGLMPEQLQRYVRRAEGELRRQVVQSYSILFCTPSCYVQPNLPVEVQHTCFEDVAEVLVSFGDLRSHYRASLLLRALPIRTPSRRDEHVSSTEPYIKAWWDKVYEMLERDFPGFFLHKTRYPRSVYFAPETQGQARYLRVDFKGHKGEVDLAFKNADPSMLEELFAEIGSPPGTLVRNGKSCAIQISGLERFVISDGYDVIETKVRSAYRAAYSLLLFWQLHRERFDRLFN